MNILIDSDEIDRQDNPANDRGCLKQSDRHLVM